MAVTVQCSYSGSNSAVEAMAVEGVLLAVATKALIQNATFFSEKAFGVLNIRVSPFVCFFLVGGL